MKKILRTIAVLVTLVAVACVPAWAAIVYRDTGAWGAGKGTTLTWGELDTNFYTLESWLDGTTGGVTLSAPTIADFTSSTHDHLDAAGGGLLSTLDAVESITFDTTATPTIATGVLGWNDTSKTLDLGLPGGVVMQIGQELPLWVKNESGSTVGDGDMVYVSGTTGVHLVVGLADASDLSKCSQIGMVTTPGGIANNGFGYVARFGAVRDIDTSAFSEGDIFYLSATTPGALTATAPGTPHYTVPIGIVMADHAVNGIYGVDPKTPISANVALGTSDLVAPTQGAVKAFVATATITDFTNATHDHADAAGGGNTLLVPTIASFANAAHDHTDAAGGAVFNSVAQLGTGLDTDGTLAADSDTVVPSQKAVKTYIDTAINNVVAITGGDTTPSVSGVSVLTFDHTTNTIVTTFDDGAEGQTFTVVVEDNPSKIHFTHGATLQLKDGVDFDPSASSTTIGFALANAVWYETSRSDNAL